MTQERETVYMQNNLEKTQEVFSRLRERAALRAPELQDAWFEATLFNTQSGLIDDYLAEAEHTAKLLAATSTTAATYDLIVDRCNAQLTALVQALFRDV